MPEDETVKESVSWDGLIIMTLSVIPPHFVATDLIVLSVGIREADVVAVKVLVLPVADEPDERSEGAYRFIGQSPLLEDGRNLVGIYRLHLIPGAVEGVMIPG